MIKGTKNADNINVAKLAGYDGGYFGDDGNDTIQGAAGNDTFQGGNGNDILVGDYGMDNLSGDAGNDILFGGGLADTITGGDGNDFASGDGGNDLLIMGNGDDQMSGSWGADTMQGGNGNDLMVGDGPFGNTANDLGDRMLGEAGNDTMSGGAGNDSISGGTGRDVMTGGAGQDVYSWRVNHIMTTQIADTITDYQKGDRFDLTLLTPGKSNVAEEFPGKSSFGDLSFIRLEETATGTMLEARIGANYVDVAFLSGIKGLSASQLMADGSILLS